MDAQNQPALIKSLQFIHTKDCCCFIHYDALVCICALCFLMCFLLMWVCVCVCVFFSGCVCQLQWRVCAEDRQTEWQQRERRAAGAIGTEQARWVHTHTHTFTCVCLQHSHSPNCTHTSAHLHWPKKHRYTNYSTFIHPHVVPDWLYSFLKERNDEKTFFFFS